ncbi:ATP-binding cassette domain-containing protein [Streptomyces violascens]|uniref:ATP-binding cassette domain-containing protein n=1 Tax=Streptomyces violascens TaxID=67381 RepID=UPI0016795A73|nr:ATP-binding cassette domain-containing protein [Streptomyces violascens]GGT85297.1 ABC transporter ATP-binding protein [Streptomyces violascens]
MAPATRLRINAVHKAYGRRRVLCGADFTVSAGMLAGVVGENGSGKSTLLRIAVGQLAPDHGTVQRFSTLGYCPQQSVVNDTLTVTQHLRLFQVAYRLPDLRHAWDLVDVLGFHADRRTRAGELSGGTRQKLNLTLALMHDPPLLVLDEPYQGFDWDTHQRFWQLAGQLRSQGRSLVVVSHLLHDLQHFDTIHHLRDSRLHTEATTR